MTSKNTAGSNKTDFAYRHVYIGFCIASEQTIVRSKSTWTIRFLSADIWPPDNKAAPLIIPEAEKQRVCALERDDRENWINSKRCLLYMRAVSRTYC